MTNVKRGPTRTKVSANAQPPRDVLLTVETRFALVTETATEGIYDWNVGTNALWVSDRLKVILGISEARSISESWGNRVHPEDLPGYRAAIVAHFKGETERLA
jgi:PAS domain-containing protein